MKKLLKIGIFLALTGYIHAQGTPTLVCQNSDGSGSHDSTIACTGTVPTGGVALVISGSTGSTATLADSHGAIAAIPGTLVMRSGGQSQLFGKANTTSGSDTFTFTFSATTQYPDISVYSISGVSTTLPFYGGFGAFTASSTNIPCPATTTQTNGDVVFAYGVGYGPALSAGSGYTLLGGPFANVQNEYATIASAGSTTPTFTFSGSAGNATCISVNLTNTPVVVAATPVVTPASSRYGGAQTIAMSCSTASSTIYYTTDGSTPTTGSTPYTGAFSSVGSGAETVKAICTAAGYVNSPVATQAYTIQQYIWFIRADGGTRYDPTYATSGQCDGLADVSYASTGGTGTNQHCAYQEFQFLYDLGTVGVVHSGWVIVGGDKVVLRGCAAYAGQQDPSNPDCRIGWSANNGGANVWCYGEGNSLCYNPPIPAGSPSQHTQFLGGCAYGTYTCTPIKMPYPFVATNETQLYSGFGAGFLLDVSATTYVDIEGLELTTHNAVAAGNAGYPSQCMTGLSENTWPQFCANNQPLDDYGASGLQFSATSTNITLQDVYIHGFNSSGIQGPIGASISLNRVFMGFNAFAGWNFTSTYYPFDIPNGTNASIAASYVTMYANGCSEEYPAVHTTFPAKGCWDANSGGFGDGWSGQDAALTSFTCDHCVSFYNTKDAFIGPHVQISNLSITNSTAVANMGSQWKWQDAVNATVLFQNNLTNNNCWRMTEQIPGARINFYIGTGLPGAYLDNFCRAGGSGFAVNSRAGAISNYFGNTTVGASNIFLQGDCGYYSAGNSFNRETTCGTAQNNMVNNVWLGYVDPNIGAPPALYCAILADGSDCSPTLPSTTGLTFTASYSSELGFKSTDPCNVNGIICTSPLLVNQPAQTWPGSETAMDVFNPFTTNNSFHPTSGSPLIGAGTLTTGTDYYGVARSSPGTIGGVLYVGSSTGGTIFSGHVLIQGVIH